MYRSRVARHRPDRRTVRAFRSGQTRSGRRPRRVREFARPSHSVSTDHVAGCPESCANCLLIRSTISSAAEESTGPSKTICQPTSSPETETSTPATTKRTSPQPSHGVASTPRGRKTSWRRACLTGIQPEPSAARIRYSLTKVYGWPLRRSNAASPGIGCRSCRDARSVLRRRQ